MSKAHIILPVLLAAFGAVILWQSVTQMDYFYFDRGAPGPGFLPFWASLGVLGFGIAVAIQAAREWNGLAADEVWPDATGRRHIISMLAGFMLFLLLINPLGFVPTTMLFVAVVGYLLGMRRLYVLLPVALVMGIFVHQVFDVALEITLPKGFLGDNVTGVWSWIF
ncbi:MULTISPECIES: tripartite tricarboxylate transporter TctB family protein [unclassified Mesorhizobium]|uniref:tripartite tricarboxylate transporter TctB family protein n=1 Tax=unclassified Mesorhizobium TaxID=325217 RepID=UPI00112A2BFB|nr:MULTISPECIES: tripartite tricarboxylate transporter TctB family protein [unclassified Mesorhizobium]MBZ9894362.1 tripartite tricarboxylate transporter TctB family protein [Mesorhizobium sp. BR1-1-6]TPM57679.1 tripartite tricarboxylate transporter TctB family protein [Mesorhizobium sp. B2-2-4]TPM65518.1 tripartite tricarboxylate transporter TctB family protein [Mesorhizobium sp. B2-2-1]TPM98493.1 tripartite tricarboxylate transporter TctB family protein [Mesorhizobium sp. B2-1-5]TPN38572.1 t